MRSSPSLRAWNWNGEGLLWGGGSRSVDPIVLVVGMKKKNRFFFRGLPLENTRQHKRVYEQSVFRFGVWLIPGGGGVCVWGGVGIK